MTRYRKRPLEVEAVQFVDGKPGAIRKFLGSDMARPVKDGNRVAWFFIVTLEGNMKLSPGDWLIRGTENELYPCKPDIFEAVYEAIEEQA